MDFDTLAGDAKGIEKSSGEKKPYSTEVRLPKSIEFSPDDLIGKSYSDALNEYERMLKIAKITGAGFKHVDAPVQRVGAGGETQAQYRPMFAKSAAQIASAKMPPSAQKKPGFQFSFGGKAAPPSASPSVPPAPYSSAGEPGKPPSGKITAVMRARIEELKKQAPISEHKPEGPIEDSVEAEKPKKEEARETAAGEEFDFDFEAKPEEKEKDGKSAKARPKEEGDSLTMEKAGQAPESKEADESGFGLEFESKPQEKAEVRKGRRLEDALDELKKPAGRAPAPPPADRKKEESESRAEPEIEPEAHAQEKETGPVSPVYETEPESAETEDEIDGAFKIEKRAEEEKGKPQPEGPGEFEKEFARHAPEISKEGRKPPRIMAEQFEHKPVEDLGVPKPSELGQEPEPEKSEISSILLVSPEKAAGERFAILQEKIPENEENSSESEIKKRMIELTKELFREKSTINKQKIKEDITQMRNLLSKKSGQPRKRAVSYAASFLNAMEVDQKGEISAAKESIISSYRAHLSKALAPLSESLKADGNAAAKKSAYLEFEKGMGSVSSDSESLAGKFQEFFTREHSIELQKLIELASAKNDKYVQQKAEEKTKEMKFTYASEFVALQEAISKEINHTLQSKKHEALGDRGNEDLEKLLSITNTPEEEILKYAHSKNKEKYYEFENGMITNIELIVSTRMLIAREAGIKKETINKHFGI